MREIRFRGKRKDTGEWIYGSIIKMDGTAEMMVGRDYQSLKPTYKNITHNSVYIAVIGLPTRIGWTVSDCIKTYEVIPETVAQITGLKDKNGKEIYEGDICTDGETKGVVHYEIQAGCYWLKWTVKTMQRTVNRYKDLAYGGQEGSENGIRMTGIEIIGNIHENPELLKP